jgi:hypothetical protein
VRGCGDLERACGKNPKAVSLIGVSECTDKADALVPSYQVPPTMKRARRNRVIPPRHDDSMVKLQQAKAARHLQANRRRIIEQRRQWGQRIRWPDRPLPGWLAEVRQASGLSTRDIAKRLDVAHSTVVRVEASDGTTLSNSACCANMPTLWMPTCGTSSCRGQVCLRRPTAKAESDGHTCA